MKSTLKKIISGGQTGVDLAALEAAAAFGIGCGGWCPPDFRNEQGIIPERYALKPTEMDRSELTPDIPRSQRTEWNVRDSDGTLVFEPAEMIPSPGTKATRKFAGLLSTPLLVVAISDPEGVGKITDWLAENNIEVLNIAGPSETEAPGIQQEAFGIIARFLQSLVRSQSAKKPHPTKQKQ